jgi:hypothetical protein
LDEVVSSLNENTFNARQIFTSDEMIHCSVARRETPVFSVPRHLRHKDKPECDRDGQESAVEYRESLDGSYRESTRRVLCRRSAASPYLLLFRRL